MPCTGSAHGTRVYASVHGCTQAVGVDSTRRSLLSLCHPSALVKPTSTATLTVSEPVAFRPKCRVCNLNGLLLVACRRAQQHLACRHATKHVTRTLQPSIHSMMSRCRVHRSLCISGTAACLSFFRSSVTRLALCSSFLSPHRRGTHSHASSCSLNYPYAVFLSLRLPA